MTSCDAQFQLARRHGGPRHSLVRRRLGTAEHVQILANVASLTDTALSGRLCS